MAGIDRDYWLDYAKDVISKSIETREKAAEKLDTLLTWIWGIYTSIFALSSLLSLISSDMCQLIFVAQPILIIMLSRYFCTRVSMPSTDDDNDMRADPNDVASIIDSFRIIVDNKTIKLRWAIIFTIVSILSISVALVGYNYFDPNRKAKMELEKHKIEKQINDQIFKPINLQQVRNDSLRLDNQYYDIMIQNVIKRRAFSDNLNNKQKLLDSLNQKKTNPETEKGKKSK